MASRRSRSDGVSAAAGCFIAAFLAFLLGAGNMWALHAWSTLDTYAAIVGGSLAAAGTAILIGLGRDASPGRRRRRARPEPDADLEDEDEEPPAAPVQAPARSLPPPVAPVPPPQRTAAVEPPPTVAAGPRAVMPEPAPVKERTVPARQPVQRRTGTRRTP